MRRSMTSFLTGLREGWGLAKPYFSSEERWSATGLLVAIVFLNLILTELNVAFTYWQRDLYNALQNKQFGAFIKLLFSIKTMPVFPYIVLGYAEYLAVFIIVAVYALYLNQMLQIRWRQWLTRDFSERWLADRAYYNISLAKTGTVGIDNPDQRISQDLASFTTSTLALGLDLLSNIVTLVSFVTVLYVISGSIKIFGVTIPGYMLWLALIYSVVGTWITHRIGKKLINLNFNQQRVEADFRYSLIRVRDNPEAIALSGGEGDELISLHERFSHVRTNWWAIMRRTKLLGFFTNGFSTLSSIFPLAAAAPRYFAGLIQLGDLVQISTVFGQVQGPLSWIVGSYTDLVTLRATVSRLHGFKEAVAAARAASVAGPQLTREGSALTLENLTLSLPNGQKLLENANLSLNPGETVLLTGASGAGKSTLFRAIAGIWPFGSGHVSRPEGTALFLPQRPYFPLGSLKRAITYPNNEADFAEEMVTDALEAVGLEKLADRLNEVENWGQILSGGEQQRLALTRALITKPDWLFLDEATSALDDPLAARVQAVLKERLPDTTIVSITHRESLASNQRHLALAGGNLAPVKYGQGLVTP
jgi:vitamin B12/bleomycin/antimicrobial peptide transport system ATP-binding/permease protein